MTSVNKSPLDTRSGQATRASWFVKVLRNRVPNEKELGFGFARSRLGQRGHSTKATRLGNLRVGGNSKILLSEKRKVSFTLHETARRRFSHRRGTGDRPQAAPWCATSHSTMGVTERSYDIKRLLQSLGVGRDTGTAATAWLSPMRVDVEVMANRMTHSQKAIAGQFIAETIWRGERNQSQRPKIGRHRHGLCRGAPVRRLV